MTVTAAAPGLSLAFHALDELPAEEALLDQQELRRAARLQSAVDRHRFVAAHAALRREIAQRLEVAPPELRFTRAPCADCGAPHGRPVILVPAGSRGSHSELHFSLSYSGGQALIATAGVPVGADMEALPSASMCRRLTALLDPRERSLILAAPEQRQRLLFTRLWCRKEAYLKGLGVGFVHETTDSYLASPESTPGWHVENVDAPPGFAAAVATRGQSRAAAVSRSL